jgi:DNA-binding CsgD family transcriptional regulator
VEPVYWDDVDEAGLTPGERDFLAEFRAVGLGAGVSLPLYGPDGRRGQGGLGFREGVRRLAPAELRTYWQVCELAHLRFCALVLPKLGALPKLSPREAEVLGWVARGKSNALIGEILGISGATVDAHLRRIFLKLGVFDRISAAVRGIGIGLIHSEV